MSDFRKMEIIINTISEDNVMTDEKAKMLCARMIVYVSELVTADEVMSEVEKRVSAIEDVL